MLALLGAGLVGVVLGMRHALEPDHLAAVSTLSMERSRPVRESLWLGAAWGLGHSLALFVVGGVLAALRTQMPERVGSALELAVAVMVVGLGVRALSVAFREGSQGPRTLHQHGAQVHTHAGSADHVHVSRWPVALRPLVVGLVHGLAGSGALTALVMAELPSLNAQLLYIATFGLGSVLGMAALTGLAGLSLRRMAQRTPTRVALLGAAGALSVVIGLWWGWDAASSTFPLS
ncbi:MULTISPECIES: urease accessory protein [Corallococcus]|uniref:HoxN/HupN/NixA family nickel/cobalt transporter n=1 Tax=Corallococcus TaxID=83461 RepID=UPI0013771C73|nr:MULTISPECIES: urease accessory protein [Corallococcus]NBD12287.1 urease accessory protein [Corallococcus silvisoli]